MPYCMDRLHRWQITGAIHADRRFNSHVGIGSRGHDFDGLVCSRVRISRSDTGENEDSGGTRLLAMTGGRAAAVDSRMLLTLFLKTEQSRLGSVSASVAPSAVEACC